MLLGIVAGVIPRQHFRRHEPVLVQLRGELQRLLSQADLSLGRLDGSILTLPNPDLFVFMYVRKEAVLSSQIEGTQSSLQDLLAADQCSFPAGASGALR